MGRTQIQSQNPFSSKRQLAAAAHHSKSIAIPRASSHTNPHVNPCERRKVSTAQTTTVFCHNAHRHRSASRPGPTGSAWVGCKRLPATSAGSAMPPKSWACAKTVARHAVDAPETAPSALARPALHPCACVRCGNGMHVWLARHMPPPHSKKSSFHSCARRGSSMSRKPNATCSKVSTMSSKHTPGNTPSHHQPAVM